MSFLRLIYRFVFFLLLSVAAATEFALRKPWVNEADLPAFRASWLQKYDSMVLRVLGIDLKVEGKLEPATLYASNHVSYLDIFILSAARPVFFVSMAEVKKWPWGGMLANMAGTIYIQRQMRSDLPRITEEIRTATQAGIPIVVFLEAGTSDGSTVLPFRGALLQPAVDEGWAVQPVHLHYQIEGRPPYEGVAWHDNTPFLLHLTRLLSQPKISVTLTVAPPQTGPDRKSLASSLHQTVLAIHEESGQPVADPAS